MSGSSGKELTIITSLFKVGEGEWPSRRLLTHQFMIGSPKGRKKLVDIAKSPQVFAWQQSARHCCN
jgi:hypothetical protein